MRRNTDSSLLLIYGRQTLPRRRGRAQRLPVLRLLGPPGQRGRGHATALGLKAGPPQPGGSGHPTVLHPCASLLPAAAAAAPAPPGCGNSCYTRGVTATVVDIPAWGIRPEAGRSKGTVGFPQVTGQRLHRDGRQVTRGAIPSQSPS